MEKSRRLAAAVIICMLASEWGGLMIPTREARAVGNSLSRNTLGIDGGGVSGNGVPGETGPESLGGEAETEEGSLSANTSVGSASGNGASQEEESTSPDSETETEGSSLSGNGCGDEGESLSGNGVGPKGIASIQVPQKVGITMDPFEIAEKGQIYSEEYMVRNDSEETVVLILSGLSCKPQAGKDVTVRTDQKGLHENKDKEVYMEMALWKGEETGELPREGEETVVLSQEGEEYQTRLGPGESLYFQFKGEMNENASEDWETGDVEVTIVYTWETEPEGVETDPGTEALEETAAGDGTAPGPGIEDSSASGANLNQGQRISGKGIPGKAGRAA